MSFATLELYRTESGALYEVDRDQIRRIGPDGTGSWQSYRSIVRVPAAVLSPGSTGEILEILFESGRRQITSRLLPLVADTLGDSISWHE